MPPSSFGWRLGGRIHLCPPRTRIQEFGSCALMFLILLVKVSEQLSPMMHFARCPGVPAPHFGEQKTQKTPLEIDLSSCQRPPELTVYQLRDPRLMKPEQFRQIQRSVGGCSEVRRVREVFRGCAVDAQLLCILFRENSMWQKWFSSRSTHVHTVRMYMRGLV